MKRLGLGSVLALAFGLAMLLSAAPAEAQIICGFCSCEDSCDTVCRDGPEVIDCPECNDSTCGASGPACGGCPPGGGEIDCNATTQCTTTISGHSWAETLNGTADHECIDGEGGNDTLNGNAGDDTITGGPGNDTLKGESGDDCLFGDDGDDSLNGGTGLDEGDGGAGFDSCSCEVEVDCEL